MKLSLVLVIRTFSFFLNYFITCNVYTVSGNNVSWVISFGRSFFLIKHTEKHSKLLKVYTSYFNLQISILYGLEVTQMLLL